MSEFVIKNGTLSLAGKNYGYHTDSDAWIDFDTAKIGKCKVLKTGEETVYENDTFGDGNNVFQFRIAKYNEGWDLQKKLVNSTKKVGLLGKILGNGRNCVDWSWFGFLQDENDFIHNQGRNAYSYKEGEMLFLNNFKIHRVGGYKNFLIKITIHMNKNPEYKIDECYDKFASKYKKNESVWKGKTFNSKKEICDFIDKSPEMKKFFAEMKDIGAL